MGVRTNLGVLRKSRGLGATELARIAEISRQTLHAIEAGVYVPNTVVALRLAQALGVGVESIFVLEEQKSENGFLSAQLIEPERASASLPVQLFKVGARSVAIPAVHPDYFIGPYDAVLKNLLPGEEPTFERVTPESDGERRLLIAGCDPATPVLVQDSKLAGVELTPWHANSSRSLQLLRDGLIHVAGCHFGETADQPGNSLLASLFDKNEITVVTLATWEEGLVVAPGNPKAIRRVQDLVNPKVSIVNRELGAGSRKILDTELEKAGIAPEIVKGYNRTAPAHLAAAREVLERRADCCIAPRIVACALALNFVPLLRERYDLVLRRELLQLEPIKALLNVLTSAGLRRKLSALGDYDTSSTGRVIR